MEKPIQVKLYKDGDQWCALIGDNLQSGICGFGDTKSEAVMTLATFLLVNTIPETIEPNTYRKD